MKSVNLLCCIQFKISCFGILHRYDKWKSNDSAPDNRPLMSQYSKTTTYNLSHSRQKELQNAIVNDLIVNGNMPVSIVEQNWFKSFMKVMEPKFVMPGRRKIENLIDSAYKTKREVLRNKLSSADTVSLTLDMWSDRRMRSFLGVTVHFLTPEMEFQSQVLDMASFSGKHTGDHIANHCLSLVDEFEIRNKLNYVITDNAANMLKAFKSMGELFPDINPVEEEDVNIIGNVVTASVGDTDIAEIDETAEKNEDEPSAEEDEMLLDGEEPIPDEASELVMNNLGTLNKQRLSCGIHSLQLVVTDGLKSVKFMSTVLSKCCRLATLLHTTGVFSEKFISLFKRTVPSTTNTRWNSIYIQLEAVSKLDLGKLTMLLTEEKHDECLLTKREMNIVSEVVAILEPAYNATMIMEEEKALVSIVAPSIISLHGKWLAWKDTAVYAQSLAKALFESLERRFSGLIDNLKPLQTANKYGTGPFGDLIYPVSASLDPDFRLAWLNDWQAHTDESVKSRVTGV